MSARTDASASDVRLAPSYILGQQRRHIRVRTSGQDFFLLLLGFIVSAFLAGPVDPGQAFIAPVRIPAISSARAVQ